ncbi:MAG: hypothetical protein CL685_02410 [Candidatus Magasanikbacteria bacterium]|nr:hypothetical protein [Candidatus Magasanikbacteria bacterium]|tara:strand:+ start:325 stop:666 length:342 start_codon:yes stop_codon:yes gene_type:complete
MFLSSGQELLYVVLAICIVWFTIFLCWLLYQAAMVLRNANRVAESLAQKLELITESVQFMRDRVDRVSKNMGVVSSLLGGLVEKAVVGKLSSVFEKRVKSKAAPTKKRSKKKK